MFPAFVPQHDLPSFCHALASLGELHGPAASGNMTVFRRLDNPDDLQLDYTQSRLPPKQYLLPPSERMLTCTSAGEYLLPVLDAGPLVLLGIHPCDLAGIAYLDRIFLNPDPDPLYAARRKRLILGGVSCEPSDSCSCTHLTPSMSADFFLAKIEGGYELTAGTPAGARLLAKAGFTAPLITDPVLLLSPNPLPEPQPDPSAYNGSLRWEEFAGRCVGCGACSACCPTCFCFAVTEHPELTADGAERLRNWDNCLFRHHGEVAGGTNFRRSRIERLHYRFRHKYYGLGPHRDSFSCVGCGRCLTVCPVDIDLSVILREYES